MSHKFWHMMGHVLVHCAHAYRHQKHLQHKTMKSRAHELSPLAGAAFDAGEQLGCHVELSEADQVVVTYGGIRCVFAIDEGQPVGVAVCDIHFRRIASDLESLLANRNSIAEYGAWALHRNNGGFRVVLALKPAKA